MHGCAARCAAIALVLVAMAAGAGCAASRPRPIDGAVIGNQGGAWEAVLPVDAGAHTLADAARRDESLSVRPAESILGANVWPEPRRPSLDQLRQRFIQSDPRFVAYYGAGPHYRRVYTTRVYVWP